MVTIDWQLSKSRSPIRELLESYECFSRSVLSEIGLGIFLHYGAGALSTPQNLAEMFKQGHVLRDGPRLTARKMESVLEDYYLKQERYRRTFLRLVSTTLCVIDTPFFNTVSMPIARYNDQLCVRTFAELQAGSGNCELCHVRNVLRVNISYYSSRVSKELVNNFDGKRPDCRECLDSFRNRLEQVEESQLRYVTGRTCVRLNVTPEVMEKLFPSEEPYGVDEETEPDVELRTSSSEQLWNSFLADYLATELEGLTGVANHQVAVTYSEAPESETFDVDCILLRGQEPVAAIETFSGGTIRRYYAAHTLRKFRMFTLLTAGRPGLKCVYVHFGKAPEEYKLMPFSFRAAGYGYVELGTYYERLREALAQKKEPVSPDVLRGLYSDVLTAIRAELVRMSVPDGYSPRTST